MIGSGRRPAIGSALAAQATPSPTLTPTALPFVRSGSQLALGQTVQNWINDRQQVDRFSVFGPAGAVISLGMFPAEGSALVPAFELYAPNGEKAAEANGANGAGGAVLTGFTLPVTGAYILFVRSLRGESLGAYTLSVGEGWTLRDVERGPTATDQINRGRLARTGDRDVWTVELPTNASVSIEVNPVGASSRLDSVLEVVGPEGKLLATARTGAARPARINALTTPAQGRYQVRVSAFRAESLGEYIMLVRVLRILPTATFDLKLNVSQPVEVGQGQRYTYSFQGVPGQSVLIEARARNPNQFDPVLELYGPTGARLAKVDDASDGSTDASLQFILNDGVGIYTLHVYGYALMPGAFTLRIKSG